MLGAHEGDPRQAVGVVKQRVNLITLGVADLSRSRQFYEALGWVTGAEPGDDVVFFQAGEMVVALWDRARLAEGSRVEDSPGGGRSGEALAWGGGGSLGVNLRGAGGGRRAKGGGAPRRGAERGGAGRDLLG